MSVLCVISGCSKAPKSYNNEPVVKNKADEQSLPTYVGVEKLVNVGGVEKPTSDWINKPIPGEETVGGAEYDALVKANGSMPIIYSSGAGGIDFKTTLTDSETMLSKPRSPPNDAGEAVYDEGLYIRWRIDEPRTPVFIMAFGGYLGKIQMPTPLAPIGLNHDFSKQYAPNSKTSAEQMAKDYYRIFEKKDASFDCKTAGFCSVDWGTDEQKNFIVSLPGMLMLISKDRMILFRIIVVKQIPQGILANNLDILKGSFLVPNAKPISLEDTYGDVEERLQINTETNLGTNIFGRNYTGIFLGYDRTKFERTDIEPLKSDLLKNIQVYTQYNGLLTLGGKPIVVSEFADKVELNVGTAASMQPQMFDDHKEVPLQIAMQISRVNVRTFAEKLKDFLATQIKIAYPSYEVTSHFSGTYQKKQIKDYSAYVAAFDKIQNIGFFMSFTIDEETGNLGNFSISRMGSIYSPFDSIILPEFNTPLKKNPGQQYFTELSGLRVADADPSDANLGSYIFVSDWDLGRNEATVKLAGQRKENTERVTYYDQGIETFAFTNEKVVNQEMAFVYISSLNVSLGLKLISEAPNLRRYAVVAIRSPIKAGQIQGLCGGKLDLNFGLNDVDFLAKVKSVDGCNYLPEFDSGGNGILTSVYFPEDRLRVSFGDFEMSLATVYAPVAEVK
jgi:hypothetical protein